MHASAVFQLLKVGLQTSAILLTNYNKTTLLFNNIPNAGIYQDYLVYTLICNSGYEKS